MACMPEATLEGTETSSSLGSWKIKVALHFVRGRQRYYQAIFTPVVKPMSRTTHLLDRAIHSHLGTSDLRLRLRLMGR